MPGEGLTHGPPATKNAGGSHHRISQIIRHSLRGGFTAYTCSPRGPAWLPPSVASLIAQATLAPAPGRPDHTISPPWALALVRRNRHSHRSPHSTYRDDA